MSPEKLKDSVGDLDVDLEDGRLDFSIEVKPYIGIRESTWKWISIIGSFISAVIQSAVLVYILQRFERPKK